MVPGQVIDAETIEFMRKLDVKEIHGYEASLGLKLIRPEALRDGGRARTEGAGRRTTRRRSRRPVRAAR
jgi:arginine decarboxylase